MSWEYYIDPRPEGSRFSEDALAAMRRYWDDYPTYRRSDGVIAICRSTEYRDYVLRHGTQDVPTMNVDVVALHPERVTLGAAAQIAVDALVEFVRFCESRWSCELLDQRDLPMSVESFRYQISPTTE